MSMAMIVLKNTPKGFKLIPVSEVSDGMGKVLPAGHPLTRRVKDVMNMLMVEAKRQDIYKTTIYELFGLITTRYGEGFFDDCKVLSTVGNTPARLLIRNDR